MVTLGPFRYEQETNSAALCPHSLLSPATAVMNTVMNSKKVCDSITDKEFYDPEDEKQAIYDKVYDPHPINVKAKGEKEDLPDEPGMEEEASPFLPVQANLGQRRLTRIKHFLRHHYTHKQHYPLLVQFIKHSNERL